MILALLFAIQLYAAPSAEQIALWHEKMPIKKEPIPVPDIPEPPPIIAPIVIGVN